MFFVNDEEWGEKKEEVIFGTNVHESYTIILIAKQTLSFSLWYSSLFSGNLSDKSTYLSMTAHKHKVAYQINHLIKTT